MPTDRDRVHAVSFYAALALITYLLWVITRPFLLPLCAAAILVIFFYPLQRRWERQYGRSAAALLSTVFVTTILIVPAVLVLIAFVREATAAMSGVQDAMAAGRFERVGRWWAWLQAHAPLMGGYRLADLAADATRALAGLAASSAGDVLRNVGTFVLDVVIVVFAMFFLFRDARPIMAGVRRILPFEAAYRERVITQAHDLIRASVVSSMAVAAAQGTAGGFLFWAVGIAAPVFWGVLMAFFSLLPIVGAWAIWLPAAIWFLANDAIGRGVLVLILGTFVVSLIDNVLRPALLAGRSQMNGLLVLISLLGGLSAFGLIGIVIGPVIVATMTSLLSAYTSPVIEGSS
jgi:predicted PurR-regulated permease PerM